MDYDGISSNGIYGGGSSSSFSQPNQTNTDSNDNKKVWGLLLFYGMTTCRLFSIEPDGSSLKDLDKKSYMNEDYDPLTGNLKEYWEGVKNVTKQFLEPYESDDKKNNPFIKAYAVNDFIRIIGEEKLYDFLHDFYNECGLSFNILSTAQTISNFGSLFYQNAFDQGIIVSPGSMTIEMYVKESNNKEVENMNIPLPLTLIKEKILKEYGEVWNQENVTQIKNSIKRNYLKNINVKSVSSAYIIKDELSFMESHGYRLTNTGTLPVFSIEEYKKQNYRILYSKDFRKKNKGREERPNVEYNFKFVNIFLEALFEKIKIEKIYPTNHHSILGNADAFCFNIVVGGSTHGDEAVNDMVTACKLLEKMGAKIKSPSFDEDGELLPQDQETHDLHIKEIKKCDLLFICNKHEKFGEHTRYQIYAANYDMKPIAFWKEPTKETLGDLTFDFPHECWEKKMEVLEELMESEAK